MSETVIKVENLSKQYRLGVRNTGTISHDLNRWWAKARGREDPFAKISEVNDRTTKGESEYVWALKDINFEVKQGEVLGIIGRNGAGKSTLLKLLSKVTRPTTGSIKMKGRVASLLEVGTGFHPELTGRENIFLNGAILGMTKKEIKGKFDGIVDFAGVERYIDTPVKRYSSGMYVRLAFAVAAHLEPEILIVDEVLAVGDAEFQKKCMGKMDEVSRKEGRTILFVSHNMAAVKNLCEHGVLLEKGEVSFKGNINNTVDEYLKPGRDDKTQARGEISWEESNEPGCEEVRLKSIRLLNEKGQIANSFYTSRPINIEVKYEVKKELIGSRMILRLMDLSGVIILSSTNHFIDSERKIPGFYQTNCIIPPNLLNKGHYKVIIHMGIPGGVKVLVQGEPFLSFDTIFMGNNGFFFPEDWAGVIAPKLEWKTEYNVAMNFL